MSEGPAMSTIIEALKGIQRAKGFAVDGSEEDREIRIEWYQEGLPVALILAPDIDDRGMFLAARIEPSGRPEGVEKHG